MQMDASDIVGLDSNVSVGFSLDGVWMEFGIAVRRSIRSKNRGSGGANPMKAPVSFLKKAQLSHVGGCELLGSWFWGKRSCDLPWCLSSGRHPHLSASELQTNLCSTGTRTKNEFLRRRIKSSVPEIPDGKQKRSPKGNK